MKCAHEACTCELPATAAPTGEYCSEECSSSIRDEGATLCHCGHDACREAHAKDATRD